MILKSLRTFVSSSTVVTPAYVRASVCLVSAVSTVSAAAQSSSALWTRHISSARGGQHPVQSSCRDSYLCLWSFHCPPAALCLVITRSPALCQFALWCLTSFLTIQQHMGDIKFASMQFYEISPLVCSQHSTNWDMLTVYSQVMVIEWQRVESTNLLSWGATAFTEDTDPDCYSKC